MSLEEQGRSLLLFSAKHSVRRALEALLFQAFRTLGTPSFNLSCLVFMIKKFQKEVWLYDTLCGCVHSHKYALLGTV